VGCSDATLTWFGDPDPRIGTAWEKGERLAKLVAHRRTLLVLDGLEPLQNPPGPQEGRLREPSLQALMRELAAFNTGLCVVTTRLPVADIAAKNELCRTIMVSSHPSEPMVNQRGFPNPGPGNDCDDVIRMKVGAPRPLRYLSRTTKAEAAKFWAIEPK
jgi:hypothetical protein